MFTYAKVLQVQMQLKYGLQKTGDCILASNSSKIPERDLRKIYKSIQYNFFYIIDRWKERFGESSIRFYC